MPIEPFHLEKQHRINVLGSHYMAASNLALLDTTDGPKPPFKRGKDWEAAWRLVLAKMETDDRMNEAIRDMGYVWEKLIRLDNPYVLKQLRINMPFLFT